MLFNSLVFIIYFLPITLVVYFLLNKFKLVQLSKGWLVVASLFFYSYWNIKYLPLILISMIFNYSIGSTLSNYDNIRLNINRKAILILGIGFNLLLLGYYKYFDFFVSNLNLVAGTDFNLRYIILPLGISFFTFTQIAYLADAYKKQVYEADFLNYALFVTFFPHLIAGPILHHSEMMPQFSRLRNKIINYKNIYFGILLFTAGLVQKIIIADNLSPLVHAGFDLGKNLTLIDGWLISFAYTFQLFFDFCGYTDMALGLGMMFNIFFPINFNRPYIAQNIQEFWRKWHITLSRFLRDYIYIPFGGNRKFHLRNLFLTFLIGGIWHGAAWTFVLWGALHGLAVVLHNLWKKLNIKIPTPLAVTTTFLFVNFAWVLFRAKSFGFAADVYKAMFGFSGVELPKFYHLSVKYDGAIDVNAFGWQILLILACFIIAANLKQAKDIVLSSKPSAVAISVCAVVICSLLYMMTKVSEFLYFNF